jgi:hypothetical protein
VDPEAILTGAGHGSLTALTLTVMGPVAKGAARDRVRKEMPMLPLVLSSDSRVFEPPDLWQTRIDAAFRDRAPGSCGAEGNYKGLLQS